MHLPPLALQERWAASSARATRPLDLPTPNERPPSGDFKLREKREAPTPTVNALDYRSRGSELSAIGPFAVDQQPLAHNDGTLTSSDPSAQDDSPIDLDHLSNHPSRTLAHQPPDLPLSHDASIDFNPHPPPEHSRPKREIHRDAPPKRENRGGDAMKDKDPTDWGHAAAVADDPNALIAKLPLCIQVCLQRAPMAPCDPGNLDCLCKNDDYLRAVMNCWTINCEGTELSIAVGAAQGMCAASFVTGPWPAESNILTAPIIYSKAAWNIQVVMSTICSLILALSIVLGALSCRAQARREASQRVSTGMGTKNSRGSLSGQGSGTGRTSARAISGQQITTFGFGEESIVTSLPRPFPPGPRKVPRFTAVPSDDKDEKDDGSGSWPSEPKLSRSASRSSKLGSKDGAETRSLLPSPFDDNASDTSDIGDALRTLPYALYSPSFSSLSGSSHQTTNVVMGPNTTSGQRPEIKPHESVGSIQSQQQEEVSEDKPFASRGA